MVGKLYVNKAIIKKCNLHSYLRVAFAPRAQSKFSKDVWEILRAPKILLGRPESQSYYLKILKHNLSLARGIGDWNQGLHEAIQLAPLFVFFIFTSAYLDGGIFQSPHDMWYGKRPNVESSQSFFLTEVAHDAQNEVTTLRGWRKEFRPKMTE